MPFMQEIMCYCVCFYSVLYSVPVRCLGPRLDEKLTPAPLADAAMTGNPIFDVPIVVIPGEYNHTVLCWCTC